MTIAIDHFRNGKRKSPSKVVASSPYFLGVLRRGYSALARIALSDIVLAAITTLLICVAYFELVGVSLSPLAWTVLLGVCVLSIRIRSELSRRAAEQRRLAARRAQVLRRIEGA
jgi:hypothetical protein